MAHHAYVGAIKDPHFSYSGEPEAWRANIEFVADLDVGGGPLASFAMSPDAQQLDWATFILPVAYEELVGWVGSRASIEQLSPDRTYVLVSVEGL